jgi:hypothetical protein
MASATLQSRTISSATDALERCEHARTVRVYVWKTGTDRFGFPTGHIGHASMHLYENGQPVRLVSWWPERGTTMEGAVQEFWANLRSGIQGQFPVLRKWFGEFQPPVPDSGEKNKSLDDDARSELSPSTAQKLESGAFKPREGQYRLKTGNWVQVPDVWEIPGMGATGVRWGLHLPSIRDWWDKNPPEKYVMMSTTKNCAGAVACALQRGGAGSFVSAPVTGLYITPNYIAAWSQMIQDRLWELELNTSRLKRKVREANLGQDCNLPRPVPSKQEWMKLTYLACKPRSYRLQAIDTAVGELYMRLQEGEGALSFSVKKHEALVKLVDAVYKHASLRPSSERRKWVLRLAECALALVDAMNAGTEVVVPMRPPRPLKFKPGVTYTS